MRCDAAPVLAALVYVPGEGAVLRRLAERAVAAGLRLAGIVQIDHTRPDRNRCDMTLLDLAGGATMHLSQDRGRDARGCRMDHGALEDAAGRILADLERGDPPDLVILSKFGKREAEGHGFRQVIERVADLGVPLLVGVTAENLEAFRSFCGGWETVLERIEEAEALIDGLTSRRAVAASA